MPAHKADVPDRFGLRYGQWLCRAADCDYGSAFMAAVWRMTFNRHAPNDPEVFLAAHLDLGFNGVLESECGAPRRGVD